MKTVLGGAPALLVFRGSLGQAARRGVVLFYHGLGAAKEANLKELDSLAERGWLAVGIDQVGHGERRFPDFDTRFDGPDPHPAVMAVVRQTVREVPAVVDALIALAGSSRLAIAGISLGGFVAYGALMAEPRLKVAAPVLGSPCWGGADSPHLAADRFFPRAILSQTAGLDENVPARAAREFHQALVAAYRQAPDRQRYVEFERSGHFMREDDWETLWSNLLEWFATYL